MALGLLSSKSSGLSVGSETAWCSRLSTGGTASLVLWRPCNGSEEDRRLGPWVWPGDMQLAVGPQPWMRTWLLGPTGWLGGDPALASF